MRLLPPKARVKLWLLLLVDSLAWRLQSVIDRYPDAIMLHAVMLQAVTLHVVTLSASSDVTEAVPTTSSAVLGFLPTPIEALTRRLQLVTTRWNCTVPAVKIDRSLLNCVRLEG